MKKVVAFIGSFRKQATFNAVKEIERILLDNNDVEFEYVFLKDYNLNYCRGCKLCLDYGEELCPLKDDRNLLIKKMDNADGVIFATPNYAFQVSALMKNFLDRLAFYFHRPKFFGKVFMAICTQGAFGGKAIVNYLSSMGANFGFSIVKGCTLNANELISDKSKSKQVQKVDKAANRFYKRLMSSKSESPSIFRLMMFRMTRTSIMRIVSEDYRDYQHFRDKGWFKSGYYYDVHLNPIKRIAGRFFDFILRLSIRKKRT